MEPVLVILLHALCSQPAATCDMLPRPNDMAAAGPPCYIKSRYTVQPPSQARARA